MTVGELNQLLQQFPPELPVYFCPQSESLDNDHVAISPEDAVMNLVARSRLSIMGFTGNGGEQSDHCDAVVVYPIKVRDLE